MGLKWLGGLFYRDRWSGDLRAETSKYYELWYHVDLGPDELDRLQIEDLADTDYTRISDGQRQLALIARALAQGAPVLVMDEPTASLDFGNQAPVLSEVAGLAADGLTVILSTHDPDHAFAVGTYAALIHDGRIRTSGMPDNALTVLALSAAYGVDVRIEGLSGGRTICLPSLSRQGESQRTDPASLRS